MSTQYGSNCQQSIAGRLIIVNLITFIFIFFAAVKDLTLSYTYLMTGINSYENR